MPAVHKCMGNGTRIMNLILFEQWEVDDYCQVTVFDSRARHVREVLRTPEGGSLSVGIIGGPKGTAVVSELRSEYIKLACDFEDAIPVMPPVDLMLAMPRPKVTRRLWSQLASMGVGRIILTNAARVERNYFDTHVLEPETYRPLLIEGLQQARDTILPEVMIRKELKPFIEDELASVFSDSLLIMSDTLARQGIGDMKIKAGGRVLLAVGPEGGWVDYERNMFAAHGFRSFRAGLRTLRTDTACVAVLALVHEALRESSGAVGRGRLDI